VVYLICKDKKQKFTGTKTNRWHILAGTKDIFKLEKNTKEWYFKKTNTMDFVKGMASCEKLHSSPCQICFCESKRK